MHNWKRNIVQKVALAGLVATTLYGGASAASAQASSWRPSGVSCFATAEVGFDTWTYGVGIPFVEVDYDMNVIQPKHVYVDVKRNGSLLARPQVFPTVGRGAGSPENGFIILDSNGTTSFPLLVKLHSIDTRLMGIEVWHNNRYALGYCK